MNVRVYEIDPDAGPVRSQLEVLAKQTQIGRATDDTWVGLRALRDGAPIFVPWKQALIFEGVCFHITVGAFSTGIAGGGATSVIDLDQPRFTVSLPTGSEHTLLPIDVRIQLLAGTVDFDNDEFEALLAVDRTQAIVDGTATAEAIFNARTDNPLPSSATARSAYTVNSTAPVLGLELARNAIIADIQGTAANTLVKLVDLIYAPDATPLLVAPCTLLGYFGGSTTTTGYAQVMWAELPASAFT